MNKKCFQSITLILLSLLLFTNCTQQPRVGLLMDDSKEGRWVKDKEILMSKIEELGGEVIVKASEGDAEKQVELAREMLEERLDVLIVIPSDQNIAAKIVKEARLNEVPVISYDRLIRNAKVDMYISFDNVHVGEMQAEYLTTVCPKGKYAIIGGAVTDNNAFMLKLGQLNVLQPLVTRGDIEIVYDSFVEEWSTDEGYRVMKECLGNNKKIDAVLASNDELAEGALLALKESGIEKLPFITGQDAGIEACRRVIAGEQTITVYKPIEAIASKTAEFAMQIAETGEIPKTYLSVNNGMRQIPAVLLPAMVVNKETINLTVVADGYLEENNIRVPAENSKQ